jgi:hypothetical protein
MFSLKMFKRHFSKINVIYKNKPNDNPNKPQEISKNHRCAINWNDRCAFCEFGYGELKEKLLSSNMTSDEKNELLRKTIDSLVGLIDGYLQMAFFKINPLLI